MSTETDRRVDLAAHRLAERPVAAPPFAAVRRRRSRRRLINGGAVVVVAIGASAAFSLGRSPDTITSVGEPSATTTPVPSTEPPEVTFSTTTAEPSASTSTSTETAEQSSVSAITEPVPNVSAMPIPADIVGVALASLPDEAGPVALSAVPDGYRVVAANAEALTTSVNETVLTAADGWSATYLRRPSAGEVLTPYLTVVIENITNNDPYWGFPGTLTATDVTLGAFAGRFDDSNGGDYLIFIARVSDTQHLVISGRATASDIATIAEGLELSSDGLTARATTLPDGFALVDQGSRSRQPSAGGTWTVSYAQGQLGDTLISVRAVSHPRDPAVMSLLGPTPSRFVDIGGYEAVLNDRRLTFDVSPTFQIQLSHDSPPGSPTIGSDDLVELARTIVGVTDQQLAELADAAAADPLTPTDMPCGFYARVDNAQSADPAATLDDQGDLLVPAGAVITVDLTALQPLGTVTFGLIEDRPSSDQSTDLTDVILATVTDMDGAGQPTSVELTWDGTANAAPVPPGIYRVAYSATGVTNPSPGSCDDTAGFIGAANVRFIVD